MSATSYLLSLADDPDRFSIPYENVQPFQFKAMNERLQTARPHIELLEMWARNASIQEITDITSACYFLFSQALYKGYPDRWMTEKKWDRLVKWLDSFSIDPLPSTTYGYIRSFKALVKALEEDFHFVTRTSGTGGKASLLIANRSDMNWAMKDNIRAFAWATGTEPAQDRLIVNCSALPPSSRVNAIDGHQRAAWGNPNWVHLGLTLSGADPEANARLIFTNKEKPMFLRGMWDGLYQTAQALILNHPIVPGDLHFQNLIYVGGGLKNAKLPPDYQDVVYNSFNVAPHRRYQTYSMQELNSAMPFRDGRYHVPPWLVPIVLDPVSLKPISELGKVTEGKAAFFDLSLSGRWGGVVTDDKITLDLSGPGCPTILPDISRYSPGPDCALEAQP